jgi:hypothetical protein
MTVHNARLGVFFFVGLGSPVQGWQLTVRVWLRRGRVYAWRVDWCAMSRGIQQENLDERPHVGQ